MVLDGDASGACAPQLSKAEVQAVEDFSEIDKALASPPMRACNLATFLGWPFATHDLVRTKRGASWRGRVVGFYRTSLTEFGVAVESLHEPGSVHIYNADQLEKWDGDDTQKRA